ncbi:MAG: hypothetical protein ACRC6R_04090 [Bacteroidales bacterium]
MGLLSNQLYGNSFPSILFSLLLPLYGATCIILVNSIRKRCQTKLKLAFAISACLTALLLLKGANTQWWCRGHGTTDGEQREIIERRNYLISKTITTPKSLLDKMPSSIGEQFQGEWALYSCSMLSAALTNISSIYLDTKKENIQNIDSLIQIVLSPELRKYDKDR